MLGQRMAAEIAEQPRRLAEQAPHYAESLGRDLKDVRYEMILLAARGSSDNAALYLRYLAEVFLGVPVVLAAPSVLTRFGRAINYPRCLAVGISQSGAGPDISEVIDTMRQAGHATLAITNTPGSRMTHAAEFTLDLGMDKETAVAATKTYSASLLAAYQLVRALGAELPEPQLPSQEWLATAEKAAADHSGAIVRCSPTFALGRGFSFSTAQESALKLMECALIACKAFSSADFEHGPKALADHGSAAISFDGTHESLAAQGCEVAVAPKPPVIPALEPIWHAPYLQYLSLTAARARGLNPDAPRHLRKVTETT